MNDIMTIFDYLYPKYKITKPIRLIEMFSGYGSQALALKYLGVPFEHWKICEWAIKSIQAYKDIHFTDDDTDYSIGISRDYCIDWLFKLGISSNYNEPMTRQQISRLSTESLFKIRNNIFATNNLVNIQQVKGQDLEIVDTDKYDNRIIDACDILKNKNIIFKNENAFDILQKTTFNKNDFIYLDPPYSNTTAIYNEKRAFGGWTIEDDYKLFDILEELNKKGIKWGLSNVFRNKEIENKHLIEWCDKNNWNVNHLNKNYASLGKGNAKSDEVYICNYQIKNEQLTIFDYLESKGE